MCAGRVPSGLRAIRLWPLCPLAVGLTGLSLMLGALCTCLDAGVAVPLRVVPSAAGDEEPASTVTLEAEATASSVGVGPELSLPASDGWDFPGKNTGVGCHFLLQGIFLDQGSDLSFLHLQAGYLPLSH